MLPASFDRHVIISFTVVRASYGSHAGAVCANDASGRVSRTAAGATTVTTGLRLRRHRTSAA